MQDLQPALSVVTKLCFEQMLLSVSVCAHCLSQPDVCKFVELLVQEV